MRFLNRTGEVKRRQKHENISLDKADKRTEHKDRRRDYYRGQDRQDYEKYVLGEHVAEKSD